MFVRRGCPPQDVDQLPDYITLKPCPPVPLRDIFSAAFNDLIDLLAATLTLNPLNRCTAKKVRYNPNSLHPGAGVLKLFSTCTTSF